MQVLAPYWWAFLAGFIVSFGLVIQNQVSRFRRMNEKIQSGKMKNSFGEMTEGLTKMVIVIMLTVSMAILLVMSIIAQFI